MIRIWPACLQSCTLCIWSAGILYTLLLCGQDFEQACQSADMQGRMRKALTSLLTACCPSGNLPPSVGSQHDE